LNAVNSVPKRKKKLKTGAALFVAVMLAYPVFRFGVMWGYINIKAITQSFTVFDPSYDKYFFEGFFQYGKLIRNVANDEHTRRMVLNSFLYFPVTCGISLPLSVIFSYFLYKKVPGSSVFRVIFYLPSILPVAVLAMVFRNSFGPSGFIDPLLNAMGFHNLPLWFGSSTTTPVMIYVYCIWAGLGFNIVLFSGAMSRVPQEIIEYDRLEGVGLGRELFQVMVPLIWPTFVTTFILGMSAVLTVFQQPYFLTGSPTEAVFNTGTIALYIYNNYSSQNSAPYLMAFGLFFTVLYVPFILLARYFMNKAFRDVDY
jgi:ABC-type sugar transport system permease subunit